MGLIIWLTNGSVFILAYNLGLACYSMYRRASISYKQKEGQPKNALCLCVKTKIARFIRPGNYEN